MASFIRRAGRFMSGLIQALNTQTFTAIADIPNEDVSGEERENVDRTVTILENMGRVEVQRDDLGHVVAARLTADGEAFRSFHFQAGE